MKLTPGERGVDTVHGAWETIVIRKNDAGAFYVDRTLLAPVEIDGDRLIARAVIPSSRPQEKP